jgi:acyl-CoA thioesterase-1
MKKKILLVLVLVFIIGLIPGIANAKLVACVGDSITYGYGLPDRNENSYPAQLGGILRQFDYQWETQNFGVSSTTLLRNTNMPYVTQNAYDQALESEPDVVIIMLGSNDTARASISQIEQNFIHDYLELIDSFAQLPSHPRIFVCYPPPVFGGSYGSNTTLRDVIIPLIEQLPTYRTVEVIDLYTPLEELGNLFPDYLHPNAEGAGVMAEIVASMILGFRFSPDLDGDYKVDIEDLIILIEHWDQDESFCDIAPPPFGDGIVDRADLEALMAYWEHDIALIAYWKLDEAEGSIAFDSVCENNGTLYGEPLWQPEGGIVNGALELDGIDDYIGTDPVAELTSGPFSIFAWIKGGAPGQTIISQVNSGNLMMADASEGKLMTDFAYRRIVETLVSDRVITDGNWHRVGLTWDGIEKILYVDDIEVASKTSDAGISENGLYIGVGKNIEAGTFWSGLIDDVRIYNRAITP